MEAAPLSRSKFRTIPSPLPFGLTVHSMRAQDGIRYTDALSSDRTTMETSPSLQWSRPATWVSSRQAKTFLLGCPRCNDDGFHTRPDSGRLELPVKRRFEQVRISRARLRQHSRKRRDIRLVQKAADFAAVTGLFSMHPASDAGGSATYWL